MRFPGRGERGAPAALAGDPAAAQAVERHAVEVDAELDYLAQHPDRVSMEAITALERVADSQAARINDRALSQLRVGETLRTYVAWILAGATLVLLGLFGFYRWVRERDAARRSERAFAVLMFDLDGFKQVNDTWGHAAGDAALYEAKRRGRTACSKRRRALSASRRCSRRAPACRARSVWTRPGS